MSQTELARQLGVRVATVNEWLNRDTMPGGAIMVHLPGILSVDGHWLLTGERRTLQGRDELEMEQLQRASALLNEALLVLNARRAGRAVGRSGRPGRIRKPRTGGRTSPEAVEGHHRGGEPAETGLPGMHALGRSADPGSRDGA